MKITSKQKTEIMNETRTNLSNAHADSLEYPNGLEVGVHIEKNTQSIFKMLEDMPDTATHSVIGDLRGTFREIRRYVLAALEMDKKLQNNKYDKFFKGGVEEAMQYMYDEMMSATKEYLSDEEEATVGVTMGDFEEVNVEIPKALIGSSTHDDEDHKGRADLNDLGIDEEVCKS